VWSLLSIYRYQAGNELALKFPVDFALVLHSPQTSTLANCIKSHRSGITITERK
jgi:hypothetical protein